MVDGETYKIPGGTFDVGEERCWTEYEDGIIADALYSYDEEQVARAKSLGYEETFSGIRQMHREHELLHSIVAEALGKPRSSALYDFNKYHGVTRPGDIPLEERICFLVAKALNVGRNIFEERKEVINE